MSQSVTILLVGHGSTSYPDAARSLETLATALLKRLQTHPPSAWQDAYTVSAVQVGFMKQAPFADHVLDQCHSDRVVVIPVFAGKGYYTDQLVPRRLNLSGSVVHRNGQGIFYTSPVGCHPKLPGVLACRADGLARSMGWQAQDCDILLIAHGSGRSDGAAGVTPRAIAAAIASMHHFAGVGLVFLEQAPYAQDWRDHVTADKVLALPLLIAQGSHANQDIPALFGDRTHTTWTVEQHQIALSVGLSAEPELVHILWSLVETSFALA